MSWANILKNQNEIMGDIIEEEREVRGCLLVLEMIRENKINELLGPDDHLNEEDLEEIKILEESSKGEVETMYTNYTRQLNLIKDIKEDMKIFYRLSEEINQHLRYDLLDLIHLDAIVSEVERMGL
mgnify:CR=1 FL=1